MAVFLGACSLLRDRFGRRQHNRRWVTGVRENLVRFDGTAPFVPVKIFLGITLFVLTTVIAVTRWRRREVLWSPATTVLYLAGFASSFLLAITLGFIGGVILYGV